MKKVLLILIPVMGILLLLAQIDDDLSKEANDLIDRVETDGDSESYLYLSGIFAEEGEDPIDEGKRILAEFRRSETDGSYEVLGYEESKKIPLPKGDAFCKAWADGCIASLFSSAMDLEKLLKKHQVLVSRSNKFLEFKEYKTLSKPTISEQLPPYQYIAAAERIKVLEAILTYKNGSPEQAIESLLLQFTRLRQSMALQDNLIGKLVFLMRLSEIIDISSVILFQENIKTETIASLSKAEKSFNIVAAREFGMSYYTFKNLDRNPDFFEMGGNFPSWITRVIYKPNMSINAITPIYYRFERLAQLSPSDFADEVKNGTHSKPSTSQLRNYVGNVLVGVSSPNFDEYVSRFIDFDVKIAIFNQEYSSGNTLENLYYAGDVPKEANGNICLNGPLEDERNLRCLKVKI